MLSGMEALCRVMATDPTRTALSLSANSMAAAMAGLTMTTDQTAVSEVPFPFLQLPFEIRLNIYSYLLPPRTHKIAPTLAFPLGSFLNPLSDIALSPSLIYKILNRNSRSWYPHLTIYTKLFLICRQITAESEPLLYGHKDTCFDFGTSLEIVDSFFQERSALARQSVSSLKIAKEISVKEDGTGDGCIEMDRKWMDFCMSLPEILPSISFLDLTFWGASGTAHCLPVRVVDSANAALSLASLDQRAERERERKWKEWAWTGDLLQMPNMREASIKCLDFRGGEIKDGQGGGRKQDFDSWLAGRVVTDEGLRRRGIWDGSVTEYTFVVRCGDDYGSGNSAIGHSSETENQNLWN